MEISEIDQKRILRKLSLLPPRTMLLHAVNDKQIEILRVAAANYQILRADFVAYFSGKKKPDFPYQLSKEQRDNIGLMRAYYLSWYTMAWEGWDYVERAAKKAGRDIPEEPGQAFTQMLEESCIAIYSYAFQESCTLCERRSHKILMDGRVLQRKLAAAKPWEVTELAKRSKEYLARVTKESRNLGMETDTQSQWIYKICRKNQRHSTALNSSVASFEYNQRTLLHTIEKTTHPRKAKAKQRISYGVLQEG